MWMWSREVLTNGFHPIAARRAPGLFWRRLSLPRLLPLLPAAAAATGKGCRGLEEDVAAAVAAGAAVVAAVTTMYLEVVVPRGCVEETETKAEAPNPGGRCRRGSRAPRR